MKTAIYYILIGFLSNSVLQRVTGAIPIDDIFYPASLLVLMISALFLNLFKQTQTKAG
jgi:hypothetical protein